jgi:hypothetical protein
MQLKERPPQEARRYFAELPDKHYPSVPAGEMVRLMQSSLEHARRHLEREPNKFELQQMYHSGEVPTDYYARMGEERKASNQAQESKLPQQNVVSAPFGGHPGDRRLASSR